MRERFNDFAEQAADTYNAARKNAIRGMRNAYNGAAEYPGTIAAIVVGIGITAFLLWAARRAGGWRNLQANTMDRMREGYGYAQQGYGKARDLVRQRVE
jgi:hypothetical protein